MKDNNKAFDKKIFFVRLDKITSILASGIRLYMRFHKKKRKLSYNSYFIKNINKELC